MKSLKFITNLIIATLFTFSFSSCADDAPIIDPVALDYTEQLTNIASQVIVPTYADLANNASNLLSEANNFKTNTTASNLDKTKQAWRSTRSPWEQSEGFLFGPVGDDGLAIDGAIDSWPVNIVDMNNLLNDTARPITEAVISAQINEAKGFHLIEYLLWGIDGNKEAADFTPRELDYLVAACENLKKKTSSLHEAWIPSKGNYLSNFINAGISGIFPSQKSALETLVDGLIAIADEVANAKIEVPLNGQNGNGFDATQEESRFSHNSKLDFANNIRSISNIYNGKFLTDGKGISDIISEKNASLDTRFKAEVATAILAIESIPGTFTDAISTNRSAVENAQVKVRKVQETLESEIKPFITSL